MQQKWIRTVVRYVEGAILGILIVDHEWALVALWTAALALDLWSDNLPPATVEKWYDIGVRMRQWLEARRAKPR
jgi:broad specificity phosphatase PhoE